MFYTYDQWGGAQESLLETELFNPPSGRRRYIFVEVPNNPYLFHVDIAPRTGDSRWRRFVFNRVCDILEFARDENVSITHLSMQSRHDDAAGYEIQKLSKIYSTVGDDGSLTFVFLCVDGSIALTRGSLETLMIDELEEVWTSAD